ncbi:MAG: DcaP family trimeric outer membrane transporter [Gammaproteobacteria bacterium]
MNKVTGLLLGLLYFVLPAQATDLDELRALIEAQTRLMESQTATIENLRQRIAGLETFQREALVNIPVTQADDYTRPEQLPSGQISSSRGPIGEVDGEPSEDTGGPSGGADIDTSQLPATSTVFASLVTRGDFPYSFKVPDTDVSLAFDGYIKADAIYDTDAVASGGRFFPDTVGLGTGSEESQITAQQSQFGALAQKPTRFGRVTGFFVGDFYGSGSQNFRLREGYGKIGNFMAGKTWSTFMDLSALPQTVALTAPAGVMFKRPSMVRWSQPWGNGWSSNFAIEEPSTNTDVALPDGATQVKRTPNGIATLRVSSDAGNHLQLGGIVRELGLKEATGNEEFEIGWGLNLTGAARLFGRHKLVGGVSYGDGMGNYVGGFATSPVGAGLSANGDLESLRIYTAYGGYQHFWTSQLKSTVSYGIADVDNASGMPGNSVKRTQTASANLIWSPFERFGFGVEYLYGKREDEDNSDADNHRIQTAVQFGL